MKMVVVSIKDLASQLYSRPEYVPHRNIAMRTFTDEVNRNEPQNNLFSHPDDYELYEFGLFDDTTGKFELYESPELIAQAKHLRENYSPPQKKVARLTKN